MDTMKFQTRLKVGAAALALALAAAPPRADAAGLGKLTVLSVLGQPLRAEIDITASSEEMPSLQASIASHEAFHRAGVEYASILNGVRVSVSRRADGRPYLSLRSDKPIYDPFIDVLLEMNWASGTLEREYTFLLDPPDATQTTPSVAPTTPANNTSNTTAAAAPGSSRQKAATASPAAPSTPATAQTEQDAPADSARTPAAVYSVKHGDTLGKIAEKTRPDSINLDQMLVALFRNNPEAFEGGNINRLRAGKILKIPGAAEAASIDAREAHNFIVAQAGDFAAYRRKLAAVARDVTPSTEEAAGQSSSGKIEPRVEEQTPTVAGKDKLEVSRATPAKGNDAKSLAARTAAIEEDLVARDKALKDANSRIAELDKNLADMKKMLELKSQGMSDAQKLAQAAKPATTPASPAPMAAPAVSAPATPTTPTIPATTKAPEEHKPAHSEATAKAEDKTAVPPATSPAAPADAAKPAGETAAAPSSPAPEPAAAPTPAAPAAPIPAASKPDSKKTAPAPAPAEEPATETAGFLDSNPEAVYGGAGILALLLGWLGFRRWKQKRDETSSSPEEDLTPPGQNEPSAAAPAPAMADTAASAAPEEASADTLANDFSIASVGEGETNESVDPIAEADVYMAYGRHAQAEEILLDALKNDPTRWAIHLKLLEIYAERQSPKQFEGIASDLHGQTGGQGEEWQQAAALGRQLDPDNTLYQDPAGGEAAAPAPQRKPDPSASATMSADEFDQLAQVLDSPAPPPALDDFSPAAPPPPSDDTPESLDFELDLGGESIHTEQPANAGMDFDLGDGAPAETIDTPAPAPAQAEPSGSGNADIEFNLDSDLPAFNPQATQAEQTTPAPETLSAAEEPPAFNPDDIGIDFPPATSTPTADVTTEVGMDMGATADSPEEMTTPATLPPSFDLSSINLDLDTPPPAPSESSASPETGLTGAPEVDTKLELAAAYEEMGDKEGARELLQEVLNEGNEAQRAAARNKLEQLG